MWLGLALLAPHFSYAVTEEAVIWKIEDQGAELDGPWNSGAYSAHIFLKSQGSPLTLEEVLLLCPAYAIRSEFAPSPPKILEANMKKACGEEETCLKTFEVGSLALTLSAQEVIQELQSHLKQGPMILFVKKGIEQHPLAGTIVQLHHLVVYGFEPGREADPAGAPVEALQFLVYENQKHPETGERRQKISGSQLVDDWSWDVADSTRPEYNALVSRVFLKVGLTARSFIRSLDATRFQLETQPATANNEIAPEPTALALAVAGE